MGLSCPISRGLAEASGEPQDIYSAKEFIRDRFIRAPVVNRKTGEIIGYNTRSTTELDVEEMSVLIESCCKFALEYFGVEIPPDEPNANYGLIDGESSCTNQVLESKEMKRARNAPENL